jgi:hypothetical protein
MTCKNKAIWFSLQKTCWVDETESYIQESSGMVSFTVTVFNEKFMCLITNYTKCNLKSVKKKVISTHQNNNEKYRDMDPEKAS